MAEIKVMLTTKQPTYIGSKKPYGHFLETERYIRGVALRGMVAEFLLGKCVESDEQKKDHENCVERESFSFYKIFGNGSTEPIAFTNLYPCKCAEFPWVLPATAKSCKTAPGFKSESKPGEKKHGVCDTLLQQLVYEELLDKGAKVLAMPRFECSECHGRMEPFAGIYFGDSKLKQFQQPKVKKRRFTRVAINRRRNTAEEAMLYSTETLDEGQEFVGRMFVPDEIVEDLKNIFLRASKFWGVGGCLSRGHGTVEIAIEDLTSVTQPEGLIKERWKNFNKELANQWQAFASLDVQSVCSNPTKQYFTVGLQSDAVLRDGFGRPTCELSSEMLKQELESVGYSDVGPLRHVRSFTSYGYRSGWSTAWGLPKEVQLTTARGSVFVFAVDDFSDALIQGLDKLECRGIGEYREEGCGRIIVCDPFHLEVEAI